MSQHVTLTCMQEEILLLSTTLTLQQYPVNFLAACNLVCPLLIVENLILLTYLSNKEKYNIFVFITNLPLL